MSKPNAIKHKNFENFYLIVEMHKHMRYNIVTKGGDGMGKTATLNLRVNPDVKENAEHILTQLGIPMATAIDMYLKQIALVGGIPFSVVLPKAERAINADMMTTAELRSKLEKGYDDIEKGNVEDAAIAFTKFREMHE